MLTFVASCVMCAGFVIGLGAVTVIDIHGFRARHSPYWTEATIRAHKITKPLIWLGTFLAVVGGVLLYKDVPLSGIPFIHAVLACILVLNGCFLSFVVSPFLLRQEREGKSTTLLPTSLQRKITMSFLISFVSWWGALFLFIWYILNI